MKRLTYKKAYDLIIDAYFKDEIEPIEPDFCFCGTLSGNSKWCTYEYDKKEHYYNLLEYGKMESALLIPLIPFGANRTGNRVGEWGGHLYKYKGYEDALFNGMCQALDVLKSIHESRGEIIDDPITLFNKRELAAEK